MLYNAILCLYKDCIVLTLPQTTQDNKEIFLLDDNLAVCENGLIFYYDDLGKIYDTKYQCVLPKINANTDPKSIQDSIIDLENILIDFFLINLRERTINKFCCFCTFLKQSHSPIS